MLILLLSRSAIKALSFEKILFEFLLNGLMLKTAKNRAPKSKAPRGIILNQKLVKYLLLAVNSLKPVCHIAKIWC